jgi:hypothetical protein
VRVICVCVMYTHAESTTSACGGGHDSENNNRDDMLDAGSDG